jgi:hypothetical protein
VKNGLEIEIEAREVLLKVLSEILFVQIENVQSECRIMNFVADAVISLKTPAGLTTLIVEVKTNGQPRFARKAAERIERMTREIQGSYGIFMAPFISQETAAILEERNIGYMDLAGNCRISFWPVYIKTVAERNPYAKRRDIRSLYSMKSSKTIMILRVMLNEPGRIWKTIELVAESGSSLGQVSSVRKKLENREWIESVKGGFQVIKPVELLTEWSENYSPVLNESRDFYSMDSIQDIETKLVNYCADEGIKYALTEFSGGARYASAVRYQKVTVYVENDCIDRIANVLSWKEVKTGANIRLYVPYDNGYFYGVRNVDGAEIVSPVQVFLDLGKLRGRGEEASEAVLKEVIAPQWQ